MKFITTVGFGENLKGPGFHTTEVQYAKEFDTDDIDHHTKRLEFIDHCISLDDSYTYESAVIRNIY